MPREIALVIPCFNEAARLDRREILRLAGARPDLGLVLVDDGSDDETGAVLAAIQSKSDAIRVIRLERNQGKAEAVRQGLLAAIVGGARVVAYADADLSTPVDELLRLAADVDRYRVDVVLASRVRLLGRHIDRHAHRHYLGRIFATFASLALRLAVYDTQCGAKFFRVIPALVAALQEPFRTRWIFDVELLARLLDGSPDAPPLHPDAIREVPLRTWRDVKGSKLRAGGMLRAGMQMIALFVRRRLFGARAARALPPAPPRTHEGVTANPRDPIRRGSLQGSAGGPPSRRDP
jgi:glycosyltransferase involved in cell wall biosynthesis